MTFFSKASTPPPSHPAPSASGEGAPPFEPPHGPRKTDPKVLMQDRLANWGITLGGLAVIAAVLGIFVFIASTTLPLFMGASSKDSRSLAAPSRVQGLLVDELSQVALTWGEQGAWRWIHLKDGKISEPQIIASLAKAAPSSSELAPQGGRAIWGLDNGRAWKGELGFDTGYDGKQSVSSPRVSKGATWVLDPQGKPLTRVSAAGDPLLAMAITSDGRLVASLGTQSLRVRWDAGHGQATHVLVAMDGQRAWVATDQGKIIGLALLENALQPDQSAAVFGPDKKISVLGWVNGYQTILAGAVDGAIVGLQEVEEDEVRALRVTSRFESMPSEIVGFSFSPRDKGFVALDVDGNLGLYYKTGERKLLETQVPSRPSGAPRLTPKSDGVMVVGQDQKIHWLTLHNPHPESTLKTLFGRVWYEGYEKPDFVWQSTGGSDDFESKLSLTPLVYGTLKGTFYALLFAVPLALLGAIYTSQFMSRKLRAWVKPTVEIMAAVPSVVMGFIAGLLLAPFVEARLFTIILGLLAIPAIALASLALWRSAPDHLQKKLGEDRELLVLVCGLFLGLLVVAWVGPVLERALFLDLKVWIRNNLGVVYDQRNSLVVGFAMGFAVIPIIYTICEDSLSSVPRHLISASLSCGATPWQTTIKVILPVALSGIFSAVMIGFGRAVGETMIVLMATGNTPVMDFSAFSGFRALSANIAVEIPEAPHGGTLYRVLFFAALILFAMTFVVNTVAEWVRLRLRKKFSQL